MAGTERNHSAGAESHHWNQRKLPELNGFTMAAPECRTTPSQPRSAPQRLQFSSAGYEREAIPYLRNRWPIAVCDVCKREANCRVDG